MHQNYFLTSKSTLSARGADLNMRKFYPAPNMNHYKGSVQTEPDQDIREEKNDFRNQKTHCVTEEDEIPRPRYIPIKPKSLSINSTPRLNGLRALQFTPNNEISKRNNLSSVVYIPFQDGQIHDLKHKTIHRAAQSESVNPFDIFMKRLTKLQHTSEIPNPEPVKHSEKSYGTIKAFGICTNQGLIRTYNEDRVSIILNIVKPDEPNAPPCSIFSLFDGHGGSKCADFLRNNLHNNIVKSKHFPWNIQEALRDAFEETEKLFIEESLVNPAGIYEKSGSCALVMVIIEDTCYICNLGDSRAVMSQDFGKSAFALTRDHKPNDKLEQKRIVAAGGRVYQNPVAPTEQFLGLDVDITLQRQAPPFRILPGKLSVSRAFGDIEAKLPQLGGNPNVLIAKPEITKLKLSENHDFILLGCDGIFDRLSNEEVVQSIWDTLNKKQATSIHDMLGITAENTIRAALLSKSFDNVTAIIVTFANFETAFNQKKDTQMKASTTRLEPSLIMSKSNFKNPNIISGLNIANSLNKSPSFSIVNFPGPDRSLAFKKELQLYEPIFEKKEDPKADYGSKRHLPNIKKVPVVKRGPTPQTNYK